MEDIQPLHAPRPRRQRKSLSAGKCLVYTVGVIGAAFVCILLVMMGYGFWQAWKSVSDPHLFYRLTVDTEKNTSEVNLVRPIINGEARFDVAVSVYITLPDVEQDEAIRGLTFLQADQKGAGLPREKVLFSDIVLRDVSVHSRSLKTTIQYRLPLDRFRDQNLTGWDLRSAMVLLPTTPGPMDTLVSYSQWKPDELVNLPKMSHPYVQALWTDCTTVQVSVSLTNRFPYRPVDAGLEEPVSEQERALLSRLYDDWGASTTLLNFIPVDANETASSSHTGLESANDDKIASVVSDEEPEEDLDDDALDDIQPSLETKPKKEESHIHKNHPYLITRTHFYAINETRPMERKVFNKLHKDLKSRSCGAAMGTDVKPALSRCIKTYDSVGEWGVKVRYNTSTSTGIKPRLGYLPYLGHLNGGAGPLDFVKIPVNRNDSLATLSADPEEKDAVAKDAQAYIDVNWTVMFSGLSAGRIDLLDKFAQPSIPRDNATHAERVLSHSQWEQTHGIFGNPAEDTRPWMRFSIRTIQFVLDWPIHLLSIHYWYTRLTSVGINRTSVYMFAIGTLYSTVSSFASLAPWTEQFEFWLSFFFTLIVCVWYTIPTILALKLVAPIGFVWKRWVPTGWVRSEPSHRERAFLRSDVKIPALWLVAAVVSLSFFSYAGLRWSWYIVRPTLPKMDDPTEGAALKFMKRYLQHIAWAARQTAMMLQIGTNQVHHTYAGAYALVTYLSTFDSMLDLVYLLPTVTGRHDAKKGLSVSSLIIWPFIILDLWQAWTLPRIEQNKGDEDEDDE